MTAVPREPTSGRNRRRTKAIRQRMAETGENYTAAMRALDREAAIRQNETTTATEDEA